MADRIEFDFDDFARVAGNMGVAIDQLPYAFMLALNRSADITRDFLIRQTWPQHIQQRNSSFIAASLTTREARASKTSLAVEIYDKLDRGNLLLQAQGGTREPLAGANLAVPTSDVAATRTGRGIAPRLKPKNLQNAFRIKDAVFVRDRRRRLKMLYTLKPTTKVPRRVPFYEDFANSMTREMERTLPLAIEKAMATRK